MPELSVATRGVLYPTRLPTVHRKPAPADLVDFVRWFWMAEWDIAPGRSSRQYLIGFPASNLVVERGITRLWGPSTCASHRDLAGKGWAVGALLRPAAAGMLANRPWELRDSHQVVDCPGLSTTIDAAMNAIDDVSVRFRVAAAAFSTWLRERLGAPSVEGLLANRMVEVVETDPALRRVRELAAQLHVSTRSVQRLAARYVGLPPAALIRRRRLQEAAERLRTDAEVRLSDLALELGYADQAHFAKEFRTVLGVAPSSYRAAQSLDAS